jgi:hypothetical protein
MKNKIDIYLELAKQARLARVPLDKSGAETLLKTKMSGTAQNIFKRFYNFFGRHLIMTITSIVGIILTGLYLNTPFQVAEHKDLSNNKIPYKIFAQNKVETKQKEQFTNAENNLVKEEDVKPEKKTTTTNSATVYDINKITWNLVVFNQKDWSFQWINRVENEVLINEEGKRSIRVMKSQTELEDKYLINVIKQLEDSIKGFVNLKDIKLVCNLEIEDYFEKLAKISVELSKKENDQKLLEMVNLYAHINRKFLNNPEEMKIKSKGLILPKENLEKLGIVFTDSTFSVPQDEYYKNEDYRKGILKWYIFDKIDTANLPDRDILLKKNIVYEWTKNTPKFDNKGSVNWQKSYAPTLKRVDFKNLFLNTLGLDKFVMSQSYFENFSLEIPDNFRKYCPLIFDDIPIQDYHYAMLNFTDDESKKLYNYRSEMEKEWVYFKNNETNLSKDEIAKYQSTYEKRDVIFSNMATSYKYKHLIPVDIQIPYYGFSKSELDTMKNVSYITLWYYPNNEFMSALPKDIRDQLKREIQLSDEIQKGEIQPEEACEEVKAKESLLGLCNLTDKAIANLNVYPNPANSQINIKFDILVKRFYKIILSDASGHYVKDLSDWKENENGQINQNFNLSELENGVYLVQVITEKSEKLLAKFLIKK